MDAKDYELSIAEQPVFRFEGQFSKLHCINPQWAPMPYGMLTRCRNCINCRTLKQWQWTQRSKIEHQKWTKHWLVTLTYRNIEDYDYGQVQKYLKMLRRDYPDKIAFICCTEYGSKGAREYHPHHHLIIHTDGNLLWKHLNNKWQHGHFKANLLKRNDAWYITKYLTKENHKIRASLNFGKHAETHKQINPICTADEYKTAKQL